MTITPTNDLLPYVQKPSRYLGSEFNSIQKNHAAVKLKFALAFPDLYDIGTSHFGIQILYHLLNDDNQIAAERVFAPADDMEALLRKQGRRLTTLESQTPLDRFDIIGFSLLYELNYTNVLNMIDLAGLPLRWHQRDAHHPLIIAGGPCVCNPEPMAPFFDVMVFGDGEQVVPQLVSVWKAWHSGGGADRLELLKKWSRIQGVYVPRFFNAHVDAKGYQHLTPADDQSSAVSRAIITDLDGAPFPNRPVIPYGKPVHDRLRMEVSRGCTRGCRFCQAGMIYRPVRERSPQKVYDLVHSALVQTGYDDLSLLSLSTGDYASLATLMESLMLRCQAERVAISLPSLRAGSLTPRLMELIRSVRKTGFTIAPEAGSQRLRDIINKNITYDDVANTVEHAFGLGWKVIKLYFMIGLPFETDDDIDAIVTMVRELRKIRGSQKRRGQINVSITTFVPKAHTPFQWCAQLSLEASKAKISQLKATLAMPGVRFKWQLPEMSLLEGLLARGDRSIADVIELAWKNGARFDGWNDQFNFKLWQQALKSLGIDPQAVNQRQRNVDEPLPWDHMDAGVKVDFLKPIIYEQAPQAGPVPDLTEIDDKNFIWLELTYSKMGPARFFGHLELSSLITRAVRRARIQVKYSKGFHPMPRISFDDPLPLGLEGEAEKMRMLVSPEHSSQQVMDLLNDQLPEGIKIIGSRIKPCAKKPSNCESQLFKVHLGTVRLKAEKLDRFWKNDNWIYKRENRKGRILEFDLRSMVRRLEFVDDGTLQMEIRPQGVHSVRASEVLVSIFNLPAHQLLALRIVKLAQTL